MLGQRAGHVVEELRVGQLPGGHVDRNLDGMAVALPLPELPARLVEDPPAQRNDEPGLLGDADELLRADRAAAGMLPADEGLGAHDLVGGQVDLGLEHERELALEKGAAEVVLQMQPLYGPVLEVVLEHLEAVAPPLLGQVEGRVGHAHELGALDADARVHGDAG